MARGRAYHHLDLAGQALLTLSIVLTYGWVSALFDPGAFLFGSVYEARSWPHPSLHRDVVVDGCLLGELGIQMIPASSPQARGRRERNIATWQGRLPQELRLRAIGWVEEAKGFLRGHYIQEFNRRFTAPAAEPGSAFMPLAGQDLDRSFPFSMSAGWLRTTQ